MIFRRKIVANDTKSATTRGAKNKNADCIKISVLIWQVTLALIQNAPRGQGGVHFGSGVHYTRWGSEKAIYVNKNRHLIIDKLCSKSDVC